MATLLLKSRYLILIPILGLALAAATFFVAGGIGLIKLLYESILGALNPAHRAADMNQGKFIYEVVEYVHTFLIGTVLYITAVGFYQLFIQEISFPVMVEDRKHGGVGNQSDRRDRRGSGGQFHGRDFCGPQR